MLKIGIDPGVNTGFACWDDVAGRFRAINGLFDPIATLFIHDALEIIKRASQTEQLSVYMEDARLRKWFGNRSGVNLQGVGSVKRDCKIIEDACQCWGIGIVLIDPKNQKGLTKLSTDKFENLTGYNKRTSVHARDAAMLVWKR